MEKTHKRHDTNFNFPRSTRHDINGRQQADGEETALEMANAVKVGQRRAKRSPQSLGAGHSSPGLCQHCHAAGVSVFQRKMYSTTPALVPWALSTNNPQV